MINRFTPPEHSHNLLQAIEPECSYSVGDDISAFQAVAREKLAELLGIKEIEKNVVSGDIAIEYDRFADDLGAREIKFYFESEKDVFVPCYLFIPESERPLPLMVALHGHSTGAHTAMGRKKYSIDEGAIREQKCDFAKQSVKNGYATLSVEQRAFGERGGNENGSCCSQAAMQALLLGRTLLGDRVWDTRCAIDKTLENFGSLIDEQRIICLGYSGGGTVATYLSALDNRFYGSVIVSAISRFCDSIGAVPHCACNYVPKIAEHFDMGELCQLIAPRNLLIVSGDEDKIFPASGAIICVEKASLAYEAYSAKEKISHIITRGGHRFYPDEVCEYIDRILN